MQKTPLNNTVSMLISVAVITLIATIIFWKCLSMQQVYLFLDIGSDTLNAFYPEMVHDINYAASEGSAVKWSFQQGMGQNLYTGFYYHPVKIISDLLFSHWGPAYQIAFTEWLKVIFAGLFFFLYFKTLRLKPLTCILGSVLYAFSGYMIVGGSWYGHSMIVLNAAFGLWAFEQLYQGKKFWLFPISIYLIGVGPNLYFWGIFLLLYSLFRLLEDGLENGAKSIFTLYGKMAGLGLLGLAFNAPGLIASVIRIFENPRIEGANALGDGLRSFPIFGFESATHYATVIMRILSNDLLGNGSDFQGWRNYLEAPQFYCGILTLLLSTQILAFLDNKRRALFVGFIGFWLLMIIFPYFRYAFYWFNADLYKATLSLFFPITLLYFGLKAFSALEEGEKPNMIILGITSIALLILLFFPYGEVSTLINNKVRLVVAVWIIAHTVLLALFSVEKIKTFLPIMLIVLASVEMASTAYATVNDRQMMSKAQFESNQGYKDNSLKALDYIKKQENGFYRVEKDFTSSPALHRGLNDAKVQNYFGTSSYSSFNQPYYIKFLSAVEQINPADNPNDLKWLPGLVARPIIQPLASIKYLLTKTENSFFEEYGYAEQVKKFGKIKVLKNKNYLPLGFAYDRYITRSQFDRLPKKKKAIALLRSFVIEDNDAGEFQGYKKATTSDIPENYNFEQFTEDTKNSRGVLKISSFQQNHIKGNISLKKPKLLFFSIPYDKGWTAKVDGEIKDLQLVNIGFMGLPLKGGNHEIELSFAPRYNFTAIIISIAALLIYLALIASLFLNKNKGNQESELSTQKEN